MPLQAFPFILPETRGSDLKESRGVWALDFINITTGGVDLGVGFIFFLRQNESQVAQVGFKLSK